MKKQVQSRLSLFSLSLSLSLFLFLSLSFRLPTISNIERNGERIIDKIEIKKGNLRKSYDGVSLLSLSEEKIALA